MDSIGKLLGVVLIAAASFLLRSLVFWWFYNELGAEAFGTSEVSFGFSMIVVALAGILTYNGGK